MKSIPFILVLLFISACSSGISDTEEQAVYWKVTSAINNQDSSNLSESDYDHISDYISDGRTRWIALYPKLNKEPFLGMTSFQEGLTISMAYALPGNPSEVLKFVDENNVNSICGMPFIEPVGGEINKYYLKARTAIMAVNPGIPWKKRCLSIMESIMKNRPVFAYEQNRR